MKPSQQQWRDIPLTVSAEQQRNALSVTVIKRFAICAGHGVGHTLHDDPETVYNYYEKERRGSWSLV